MLNKIKIKTLKSLINFKLKKAGRMLDLKIDPKTRSITMETLLLGETEPISIKVVGYEINQLENKNILKFEEINTSKTWLNILLNELIPDKELEISNKTLNILKIIL
jgi:hypothetical protein